MAIESMRQAARIPGLALAIVAEGETLFAKGFGYRDHQARLPMTSATTYPIASTTKAINATLLGMLVDEGRLAWDAPVESYLPSFRLGGSVTSGQITVRDLIVMRTGLPRHDWLWIENPLPRDTLVARLNHLELSAGFRERYQYNNLTVTTAGYIAEHLTGQRWEDLVSDRILRPLDMNSTTMSLPAGNATLSYHENGRRELLETRRLASDVTAPSGGSIHSSVSDMTRWMLFNLQGGRTADSQLIDSSTLAEIHKPQILAGTEPAAPTPSASYAMGWFVDSYNGCTRISHGGYLHDVNSEVMLFPKFNVGVVSFVNFGPSRLARLIGQHSFDMLMGYKPVQSLEDALAAYEQKIESIRSRDASLRRVPGTSPSHELAAYEGRYFHAGYGELLIERQGKTLTLRRHALDLPLEHWHYDTWVVAESDLFQIHTPHPFDRASRLMFDMNADGDIAGLSIQLEPAVPPIHFVKR